MSEEKKKKKNKIITSPAGIAVYPWLNKADTKFKPEGEYTVKLRLKLYAEDSAALIVQIAAAMVESVKDAQEKNPKKKIKKAVLPYKEEVDDNGVGTGNLLFSFKMKASYKNKAGEVITMSPALYDKYGKPLSAVIYGGSRIKIAYVIDPYYTATVGAGVSLKMYAVQVLELVTGANRSVAGYGFDVEEAPEDADVDSEAPEDVDTADAF